MKYCNGFISLPFSFKKATMNCNFGEHRCFTKKAHLVVCLHSNQVCDGVHHCDWLLQRHSPVHYLEPLEERNCGKMNFIFFFRNYLAFFAQTSNNDRGTFNLL